MSNGRNTYILISCITFVIPAGRGREPVREWEKPLTVVVAIR